MKTKTKLFTGIALFLVVSLFFINLASAISIDQVTQDKLYPGEQAGVNIEVKNTLDDSIENVNLMLDLSNTNFISVGSASDSIDEIFDGDTETFNFEIKASSDIKPGDYNVPYILTYNIPNSVNSTGIVIERGTVGISVGAKTELDYFALTENPVVGQKGTVSLKIINSGLADIKFVDVKITSNGFTLLGSNENYIGTVSSNDFETATYDVIFSSDQARLSGTVSYKDFDNNDITQNFDLPLTVYTQQRALELGIIQPNNSWIYLVIIVVLVILWFVWRIIRKRRKKKKEIA
jgi:hypothetical protein